MFDLRDFVLLVCIITVVIDATPIIPSARHRFSLQSHRILPRNANSRLPRRNPDAVSFHTDPAHMFAWTPIQLGGQNLGVMLDIGSTQFWVFSSQNNSVQPSGLISYTQLYVPGNSPTWQSIPNSSFSSGYMAGFTATGIVGTDVLMLGEVAPVKQHVGVMWYDKPVMDPQQIQGILGLGLGSEGTSGTMEQATFLDLIMPTLASPFFTLTVDGYGTGVWDFGHINSSRYTGSLTAIPVDSNCNIGGSWVISGVSAQFPESTKPQTGCVMLDTGWDMMNLQPDIVARYYQDIPGAESTTYPGQYTFPCDSPLPDLKLIVSGAVATLPGRVINYHPLNDGSNRCMGSLQNAWEAGAGCLGQAFFMGQYVVFDHGDRTMSLADAAAWS